jgi:hypothetical protein
MGAYMTESNLAEVSQSSGKDHANEKKTYRIPISNGIFEHYGRLKDARWLLDLYVDWTTKEVPTANGRRDGIVLGGKPVCDEDIASAFNGQCSQRTARRWRQRLARYGYISQKRTPMGYVIRVMKSKKWAHLEAQSKEVSGQKWPVRAAKNGRSEVPDVATQSGHDRQFRSTDRGRCNKDSAVQDKDRAVEAATSTAALLLEKRKAEEWSVIGLAPVGERSFQKVWTDIYAAGPTDEPIADMMERCITACRSTGISVPRPFYDAKHRAEELPPAEERGTGELPYLVAPE